ncbi:MAG TPA: winged helix-turn-helix domain-containing protein [Gemmataceae bacterium]|jgi:DNA-binding response OmpR family regulator|nr:winged helix-turn-helix domain-containing protein [Gemmataceae bacterium]
MGAELHRADDSRTPYVGVPHIRIDEQNRQVTVKGRTIALTPTEFRLLAVLMARPGEALSRSELMQVAISDAIVGDRTIDVHVASLRRKLGLAGDQIKAVRGIGYRFDVQNGD